MKKVAEKHKITRHKCPVCDAPVQAKAKFDRITPNCYVMSECDICSFVFLMNPPNYTELQQSHGWDNSFAAERIRRRQAHSSLGNGVRKVTRRLRKALKRSFNYNGFISLCRKHLFAGIILDLAAGRGRYISDCLPEKGIPIGIEMGKDRAEKGRPFYESRGGAMHVGPVLHVLPTLDRQSAAGVIAKNYLEHELNPREVLTELSRVLLPNASLVFEMPNYGCLPRPIRGAEWCGYRFPDHVNYFTPQTLTRVLKASGFEVVKFDLLSRMRLSDKMRCVARKSSNM